MKKLVLIILLISMALPFNIYAFQRSRVAIVGNSLASSLSCIAGVDNDMNFMWAGNHSVGGDGLDSLGTPQYMENERTHTVYPPGSFRDNISSFPNQARNYDLAFFFFGSNELLKALAKGTAYDNCSKDYFITRYKDYIEKSKKANPKLKIVLCEIPCTKPGTIFYIEPNLLEEWNNIIRDIAKEESCDTYKMECLIFNYDDPVHFTYDSYLTNWYIMCQKYSIK